MGRPQSYPRRRHADTGDAHTLAVPTGFGAPGTGGIERDERLDHDVHLRVAGARRFSRITVRFDHHATPHAEHAVGAGHLARFGELRQHQDADDPDHTDDQQAAPGNSSGTDMAGVDDTADVRGPVWPSTPSRSADHPASGLARRPQPGVVDGAAGGIPEDPVRLVDRRHRHPTGRRPRRRLTVGMVLTRQLPVGVSDLRIGRRRRHAQRVVMGWSGHDADNARGRRASTRRRRRRARPVPRRGRSGARSRSRGPPGAAWPCPACCRRAA